MKHLVASRKKVVAALTGLLISAVSAYAEPGQEPGIVDKSGKCAQVVATIDSVAPVCPGDAPFALTISPAGGILYGEGLDGPVFTPAAGTQTVMYVLTSPDGCSDTATRTIVVRPAALLASAATPGGTAIDASYSGTAWSTGANARFAGAQRGFSTSQDGCGTAELPDPAGSARIAQAENEIRLYPQPAHDLLQVLISSNKPEGAGLTITEIAGHAGLMRPLLLESGENVTAVDISTLPAGMYQLVINHADGTVSRKRFLIR